MRIGIGLGVGGGGSSGGASKMTASKLSFLVSASSNTLIATMSDPFAGTNSGNTVYSIFGSAVPQIVLRGNSVYTGVAATTNTSYSVGIAATSGDGKKIYGDTFTFAATGAPAVPDLRDISLSVPTLTQGIAATIAINDTTPGSLITGNVPAGMSINNVGRTITGTPTTTGIFNFSLVETLAGSPNSPKTSAFAVVVQAPPVTLGALTLSSTTVEVGGNYTINIIGAKAGSTLSIASGIPTGMTLNSAARTITGIPTAVNTFNFNLVETLAGSSNNNRASPLFIQVNASTAQLPLTPFILDDPKFINGPIYNTGDLETRSISNFGRITIQPSNFFSFDIHVGINDAGLANSTNQANARWYSLKSTNTNYLINARVGTADQLIAYAPYQGGQPPVGSVIEFRQNEDFTGTLLVNGVPEFAGGINITNFSRGFSDPTGTKVSCRTVSYNNTPMPGTFTYGPIKVPLRVTQTLLNKKVGKFNIHIDGIYSGSPSGYQIKVMLDNVVISDWTDAIINSNDVPSKIDIDSIDMVDTLVAKTGGSLNVSIRQKNDITQVVSKLVDYPAPLKIFMNASGGGYFGGVLPFIDLFRSAPIQTPTSFATREEQVAAWGYDSSNIPHKFNGTQQLNCLVMRAPFPQAFWGWYTVTSKLPFSISSVYTYTPRTLVNGVYTQRVLLQDSSINGIFSVQFKDEGVPVPPEGILCQIIKDGESEQNVSGVWQPLYLEDYKSQCVGIRFMDLMGGNGCNIYKGKVAPYLSTPADRGRGIGNVRAAWSFETMIDLCNKTNCDAYVTIPYSTSDAYVQDCIQTFHDGLANGLRLFVEYSNELWNDLFSQTNQVRYDGFARNYGGGTIPINGDITKLKFWDPAALFPADTPVITGFWLAKTTQPITVQRTETITHTTSTATNAIHTDSTTIVNDWSNKWLTVGKITDTNGNSYYRQTLADGYRENQDFTTADTYVMNADGTQMVDANNNGTIAKTDIFWGYVSNNANNVPTYYKWRNEPAPGAALTVSWMPSINGVNYFNGKPSYNPWYVQEQDGGQARMKMQAQRSKEIFMLAQPIYADKPDDLITVIGGQTGSIQGQATRFTFNNAAAYTKRIAVAPYIGDGVGGNSVESYSPSKYNNPSPFWNGPAPARKDNVFGSNTDIETWKTDLFTHITMAAGPVANSYVANKDQIKQLCIDNGLSPNAIKLMAYEANQHLFFESRNWGAKGGGAGIHPNVVRAMIAWWQDPRIGEVMRTYLDRIESAVGNEFCWYSITSDINYGSVQYGSWISNRWTGDRASPRYMTIRNKKLQLEGSTLPKPAFVSQPSITPLIGGPGSTFTVNANTINGNVFSTEWSVNGVRQVALNNPIAANVQIIGVVTCQVGVSGPGGLVSMISTTAEVQAGYPIIDQSPPVITTTPAVRLYEGLPLAVTLTTSKTVTWSVDGGEDATHFEVSGNILRWKDNGVKTYATPEDVGKDNIYNVIVRAFDSVNNNSSTIAISVTLKKFGAGQTTADTGWVSIGNTFPAAIGFTIPDGVSPGGYNIGYNSDATGANGMRLSQAGDRFSNFVVANNVATVMNNINFVPWPKLLASGDRVEIRFPNATTATLHLNGGVNLFPANPGAPGRGYVRFWNRLGVAFDDVSFGAVTP
jgi:hypothetical protein